MECKYSKSKWQCDDIVFNYILKIFSQLKYRHESSDDTESIYAQISKSVGTGSLKLKLAGIKLKNIEGYFNKSDPFFEIYRKSDGKSSAWWGVKSCSVH